MRVFLLFFLTAFQKVYSRGLRFVNKYGVLLLSKIGFFVFLAGGTGPVAGGLSLDP